jgi:hypothetical protein
LDENRFSRAGSVKLIGFVLIALALVYVQTATNGRIYIMRQRAYLVPFAIMVQY